MWYNSASLVIRNPVDEHADTYFIGATGSGSSIHFADKFCIFYDLFAENRAVSKSFEEIVMHLKNFPTCFLGVPSEVRCCIISCQGMETWQYLKNLGVHLKMFHNCMDRDKLCFFAVPAFIQILLQDIR
jgi:hypothetical protein